MYGDRGFESSSPAPVKVGDEFEVTIEAVGAKGDGIAKKEGFVLFVPGVQKGDNVKIRVTRVLRKVGFAEVAGQGSGETEQAEPAADNAETPAQDAPEEPAPQDSEDFGEEKK